MSAPLVPHEKGQKDLLLKAVWPLIALMEDHVKEAEWRGLNGEIVKQLLGQLTTTLMEIQGTHLT